MITKRELQIQADDLKKNNSKKEAMAICRKLWDEYPQNEQDNFNSYDAILTLKATKDKWRENIYTIINIQLNKNGGFLNYIIQITYKETVGIIDNNSELIIDLKYDSFDYYLSRISSYYSKDEICEDFKSKFSNLRNNL